jgi:hypothetical protein
MSGRLVNTTFVLSVNKTSPPAGQAGTGAAYRGMSANQKTLAPVGQADPGPTETATLKQSAFLRPTAPDRLARSEPMFFN